MPLNFTTALFAKDPLWFLKSYAINPPADPNPQLRGEQTIPHAQGRFKSAEVGVPIAWIKLSPDPLYPRAFTFDLEFAAGDVRARIERADRLPVYYLPWEPDKFVRMSIPAYREQNVADFGIGRDHSSKTFSIDPYNPHLFFTAGLTGCSVFVYGDPRQPTVTHVGTRTDTPFGDDCALFWRELLFLERCQRGDYQGMASEANMDQYQGRTFGKTRSIGEFCRWLATRPEKFTIEDIIPYGAVFGIRYGSLWSFYLQECGVVYAYKVVQQKQQEKQQLLTFFEWAVTKTVTVKKTFPTRTIPFSVRPFFPKGGGSASLRRAFKYQTYYYQ